MSQQHSIVIHFKVDHLAPEQRFNPFLRRAILDEGIAAVRKAFPTVVIGSPMVGSLSVVVRVSADLLPDLLAYLENHQLSEGIVDGKMLRAVRDGEQDASGPDD